MQLPGDRYTFSERADRAFRNKKRSRLTKVILILVVVIGVGLLLRFGLSALPLFDKEKEKQTEEKKSIETLWSDKNYVQVNERCNDVLAQSPLSERHLLYNGFAYFYRGVNQYTPEDQLPLFNKALVNLRKLLVLDSPPEEAKVHYVLGKTYYHKGRFYLDAAVRHLKNSVELGYSASDTYRYIGLTLGELGDYKKSVEYFLKASEKNPDEILYMTIGRTYYKMGNNEEAVEFLKRSVQTTEETAIEQRARFLLGKIYKDEGELEKAKEQYRLVVSNNPKSADAHYHLGEIFEMQGEKVKARAEWREALDIEPSHYGALLKMY